jgi:hypothetical protein
MPMMEKFQREFNGFSYVYERKFKEYETVILKMPTISPNKRGVNDVGWLTDGDVTIYGTLSAKPESADALWQAIEDGDDINKTVSAVKIVNNGPACRVAIRAILN